MKKIVDTVSELARPVAEKLGLTLWDVEYLKEAGEWYLRVYLDKEGGGGVSIDDCEKVSKALDPILDEMDPISGSYTFEVSSAGLERTLKTSEHFERFIGSPVVAKLYSGRNGKKEYSGILSGYQDGDIKLNVDGEEISFDKKEIAHVRLGLG